MATIRRSFLRAATALAASLLWPAGGSGSVGRSFPAEGAHRDEDRARRPGPEHQCRPERVSPARRPQCDPQQLGERCKRQQARQRGERAREPIDRHDHAAEQEQHEDAVAVTSQSFDVTDLLDEIDTVLEQNAEEFVKSFVQKGGE